MRLFLSIYLLSIFAISNIYAANVKVMNLTRDTMSISFNNGEYITIPSFGNSTSTSFRMSPNIGTGELGMGENMASYYASAMGPGSSQNMVIHIPDDFVTHAEPYMIITPKYSDDITHFVISPLYP